MCLTKALKDSKLGSTLYLQVFSPPYDPYANAQEGSDPKAKNRKKHNIKRVCSSKRCKKSARLSRLLWKNITKDIKKAVEIKPTQTTSSVKKAETR